MDNERSQERYHLYVEKSIGDSRRFRLMSSPFDHESRLDQGTQVILSKEEYEKIRTMDVDLAHDPQLKRYKTVKPDISKRLRGYDPYELRRIMDNKNGFLESRPEDVNGETDDNAPLPL